jgi:tetratricopeptide (TPR) repeat protein
MTNKPVVFISATSDLSSARDLVGKILYAMGYEPVWQDIAATDGGELLDVLRRRLKPAALVIQLVGQRYGAEPPQPTKDFGRVSYTQFEALEGERLGKKVIYHCLDDRFPIDPVAAEPPELASLQTAYLERLKNINCLRYDRITDTSELELSIRRISDELATLRRQADRRQRRLVLLSAAAVVGIIALAALTLALFNATRNAATQTVGKLDQQAAEIAKLSKAFADVQAAVTPKPLAAGQTHPDPIPPAILVKAQLLLDRGNEEQRALGMIALKQHDAANQLIQQLKRKAGNPIDEAFQLLSMEGDNWYQAGEPDKALGPYEQAFALKPSDFKAHNQLVCALILGRDGDVAGRRLRAIKVSEQTLKLVGQNSSEWAKTQNNIGISWQNLPTGDKTENVQKAISAYQAALGIYTKDTYPDEWAWTQDNLGLAWSELATGSKAENVQQAITAFEAALTVRTRAGHPAEFARTQENLGVAWSRLPTGNQAENRKKAIAACQAGLTVYSNGSFPRQRLDAEASLSWVQLVANDFGGALTTASRAANEGVVNLYLEMNRAHALLLLRRSDEAKAIYLKYLGSTVEETGRTWEQFILQDFDELESHDIDSPEFPKLRKLLKQSAESRQSSDNSAAASPAAP